MAVLLGAGGCATESPFVEFPDITFRHMPVINLRVVDIQIDNKVPRNVLAPHVGHKFPVPPVKALRRWGEDRLQAAGSKGTARFTILEADAIETPLAIDQGVRATFTKEQSERYVVTVSASLEIFDENGIRRAFVKAKTERRRTVAEDITLTERRKVWFEITEKLMAEFNAEMERNIQRYMTEFAL
ncbi:MAG: hypothetical protein QGH73_09275 [Rhodospirillales bacterium]|nr:hypothetical protein [Rhodospirillaceae bacterium]MDP6429755.1 hypothetical protein [Rhodospirillales bacterium]MDP6841855.1 hypothetical protein [Rhodospirillales bacterium]